MKKHFNAKGTTLVEVIVAVALIGIISISFITLFTNSFSNILYFGRNSAANYNQQELIENIIANSTSGEPITITITFEDTDLKVNGSTSTEGNMTIFIPND